MDKQARMRDFKLTPQEYQGILKDLEFESVSLIKLIYEIGVDFKYGELSLAFKRKAYLKNQSENKVIIGFDFKFHGKEEGKNSLKIEGTYDIHFKSKSTITPEFIEIFENVSLGNLVWPYIRELCTDISVRSNMPPIFLPLLKFIPEAKEGKKTAKV